MRHRQFQPVATDRKTINNHAQVVHGLGKAIVAGEFSVGNLLPGDVELAERFKVSRTVLREAMKTLAAKGLIVARARVGTRVTEKKLWNLFDSDVISWHFETRIDEAFLLHLYDIRLAFEPFAAGLAAERATPQDVDWLAQLVTDMSYTGHSSESLAVADLKFHLAVAEVAKNPFMQTVGNLIEAALAGIFRLSSPAAGESRFDDVSVSHRKIVEAIHRHDRDAARKAMEDVILAGRSGVAAQLAASLH